MRIKKFTFLTLALLLMSVVAFAQRKASTNEATTAPQREMQAMALGQNAPMKSLKAVKRAAPEGALFFDDFETGLISTSSWTVKTLGEGDGWIPGTPKNYNICDAFSGDYVASSWSWNSIAYNVDNWLITPKVALGGSVVFWAYTHANYPDKYEVLLSTTGTETTDFTVSLKPLAADAGGTWVQHVIDLSAYAGQDGYIAIRHQDYDQNYLFIDDFAVTEEPYEGPTTVTPPTGLNTTQFTILAYDSNDEPFERVLTVGIDGTDVYVQGTCYNMPDAWIKGTLNQNGTVTFATGQFYGMLASEGYHPMFFQAYDYNSQEALDNLTLTYNPLTGSITWPQVYIMDCETATGVDEMYTYYEVVQAVRGTEPDALTPPAGIENNLAEYRMVGDAYDNQGNPYEVYSEPIFIGIDGNDVWVKGVCKDIPDAWIKGTKNGNTVTFPTGQKFDVIYYWGYTFKYFFAGYDEDNDAQADVTMTLDSNTGIYTMTSPDRALINSAWLNVEPNLYFLTLQFLPVLDVAATPAQPTITGVSLNTTYPNITVNIPATDVDGYPILASKLSYQYYYDVNKVVNPLTLYTNDYTGLDDDMTEIPYNFTDNWDVYNYRLYLNQDYSTWNKIGIQSIYRGGGEEKRSEIFWYTLSPYPHEITFVAANDVNIQNGMATVKVNGKKATVDADGKLAVQETYVVTLNAAKGYKFTSVTSTGATIELDKNGFVATFEMPAEDITVNYEMRELYNEIQFVTTGEYTIQDGQATVAVDGDDVTEDIDETGKLLDVAEDATVTITAEPGFKLANVTASYKDQSATGGGAIAEVQVGDGDKTDNYLPTYNLYNYSLTQQIYTASEIGQAGSINSIAYYCTSQGVTRDLDIYLVHTSKDAFDSTTDWIVVSESDKVFSGDVTFTVDEWTTITFDTPFNYNGTDNLCVVVDDNTGTWHSSMHFKTYDAANQSIVVYHDETNYEISSTSSYTGYFKAWKNQMILDISPVTTLDVDLAADGSSASFTVPDGNVTVVYELERLGTPVEVAAGKYITYYTDKDVVIFDEDCELLTVTAVDATTVTATPIEVAAARTPLLVYNSSDKDKKVWIVPTEETPNNLTPDVIDVAPEFKGTLEEKTFTATEMSAAKHFVCNGETFMLVRREGIIGANKCWLELSNNAPQNARTIVIGTAEATGIADVNHETITNNRYYDLQGRLVMQPAKGLYINNGKKVMVK